MNETKHQKNLMVITIVTAAIVAMVLILGTIATGRSASRDTNNAVRNVSLLYLDELAGRREQVVASRIYSYIDDMYLAVRLLSADDLSSKEALSKYQSQMKQLYDLDKFAFIDENGLVYTSHGVAENVEDYPISYKNLTEPTVTVRDPASHDKKVIIAIPVSGISLEGNKLVVCFMELDAERMLKGVSLQSDNNDTTFCNIYTKEGNALTDMVLGGLAHEDNLLSALENAEFEDGYHAKSVRKDFETGRKGEVSFCYNGINETLCYEPIENTDWMLTYLIRESVISKQISSISHNIITRSLILSMATAGVLLVFFATIIGQSRKAQSALLEKEVQEAKNRAKSTFLSNMSHEIRTPITAVLGMNEMIQRECRDENILAYSDNIKKAGISLLGIINDILDFSKIESGHMELNPAEYSFSGLIADLYNMVRFRAAEKGLTLVFDIDPMLPEGLYGDELRLKQVMTNLLTNAVKYTTKGSVTLLVKKEDGAPEGQVRLFISVSDTGIGIREEEMGRLFHEFDRLDYRRNRSVEGTGLGLAISRRILHLMDSEMVVSSVYGEGSVFSFNVLQEISDAQVIGDFDVTRLYAVDHKKPQNTLFWAPNAHILIVDDTPMNLQVITNLLKRTGVRMDTATNGMECVSLFGKNDYDLVLLDYRMPQMDGIETLARLKELYPDRIDRTPVISLTASAVEGSRELLMDAGFDDYLAKPVDPHEMERVIAENISGEKVTIITQEANNEQVSNKEETSLLRALHSIRGLDADKGLNYCGDEEDYKETLITYVNGFERRNNVIREDISEGNSEDYVLQIHSLKSMSLAIGAVNIPEEAARLEEAAVSGDIPKEDTERLLAECEGLVSEIKDIIDCSI